MTQTTAKGDDAKRYKASLNLLHTSFPMKANLVQNEPASLRRWDDADLYAEVTADPAREGRFVFHDGPPYANARIHMGHMLNKCLKDFVVRSKLLEGLHCPFVPGWDCHGLPIEHRVMQDLGASGKLEKLATLDDAPRRMAIRRACQTYAAKQVKLQAGQMRRLLTLADYDDPYLTMVPGYEGAVLDVFADLVEQGVVYRQLKAVHWSIANETALAEAELEYEQREDISVYVDFEAADRAAVWAAFDLDEASAPDRTPSFMIWTTTPWTLPANLAIAVHADFTYALARIDGNDTIVARERLAAVTEAAGAEDVEILAETTGARLAGLRYRHPFVEGLPDVSGLPDAALRGADPQGVYRVVLADYVTLGDGTGLVHTAPGHGADDYHTGLRERLPIYCPVRADGTYDASVPEWLRGQSIWDANERIVEHVRRSGHLFFDHRILHSYPHDWRSKTPVIFRATEQWFVAVDEPTKRDDRSLRAMALAATAQDGDVEFIPAWGRNRLHGMLELRPDWCISRQRSWGLPIPAFSMPDGTILLTAASVRAVAQVFRASGSDVWFTETPRDLLRHYDLASDPDAPAGIDVDALRPGRDIFDVWFESGSSWNAVVRERSGGEHFPIDLYLEGSDQHRGWFQLSLLPGLGSQGCSPYRRVLTHGFVVAKDGRKMSKSLGNALDVDELVASFGADVCRWWVASASYEADVRADVDVFKTAGESYRKIRNTLRFLLGNLHDFDPAPEAGMLVPAAELASESLDAWACAAFDDVSASVRGAYERFQFQRASTALYDFCNDALSATYLSAAKDRLYCDAEDAPRRRRTQSTLWRIADGLCRLLAPILPHTADEAWRELHRIAPEDAASVHARRFLPPLGARASADWPAVLRARDLGLAALEGEKMSGGVENPLDAGVVLPDPDGVLARFDRVDLADLLGASRVELDPDATAARVLDLRDEPRCERSRKRDGTVRERSDGGMLSDRDAAALGV